MIAELAREVHCLRSTRIKKKEKPCILQEVTKALINTQIGCIENIHHSNIYSNMPLWGTFFI